MTTDLIKINKIPAPSDRLKISVSTVKGSKNNKIVGYQILKDVLNNMVSIKNNDLVTFTNSLLDARSTPSKYNDLKNKDCPGFIIGRFAPVRNDSNCEIYVPLLGFDIDNLKDEFDCDLILADCRNIPEVFLAYPSPSRKGLRIFIWCNSTPESHKETYEAVCSKLGEYLRLKTDKEVRTELKEQGVTDNKEINKRLKTTEHIDTSTKNISRLWFYTHLEKGEIYLNQNSVVFSHSTPSKKDLKDHTTKNNSKSSSTKLDDNEKVRICVKMAAQRNILAGRNNGLYSLACLMVEHGVSQNSILEYCLKLDDVDFSEQEIIKTVKSAFSRATPNKFNDAQLKNWIQKVEGTRSNSIIPTPNVNDKIQKQESEVAEEKDERSKEPIFNWKDKDLMEAHFKNKNLSAYLKIKPYILSKYEFRTNTISNDIEYRRRGTKNPFEELNEFDLECELYECGMKSGIDKPMMTILKSNHYVPKFNPIKAYFQNLPKWDDSQPDYIDKLANFVSASDQEWFNYQFKKMMVRTAACSLNYIPFNKQCFTMLGEQNDGKTSFFRFLCPPELMDYYKENIDITSKDGQIALCQNMFINFEELDAMNKKELNKIKAMFSVEKVKVRPPYERRDRNFARVCNFLASSNRKDILTDETGNVRWLVFEINGIYHDGGGKNGYNQNININLVWAQVYHLLNNGYPFKLTKEDIAKSEKNNKAYQQTTPEMEWVQKLYISSNKTEEDAIFKTATDIYEVINLRSNSNRMNHINVGRALTFLSFVKSQEYNKELKKQQRGYWVKETKYAKAFH